LNIVIQGHTDNIGDKSYNQELSLKRSESIKNQLVKRGINENRIKTVGLGDNQPTADNSSEQGRKQNRRIEIIIE
jgi:outer membrane protein OmpA-like peptidoglycan-associated protein